MGKLSSRLTQITFGTGGAAPTLSRCQIDGSGNASNIGSDGGTGLIVSGDFSSQARIWNAVWNDIADFQLLNDELIAGKCYFDTKDGARICNERCQMSVIGIASDTFGYGVGTRADEGIKQVPVAVCGWVLAYVDREYECGTVLTNNEDGILVEMTREEKLEYPERIVAIYKRKEAEEQWGPENSKIEVNGRHWVKVKS